MTTVKFSSIDKLKEIQSRVYLLTQQNLTQQEILEYAVLIISENIDLLVEMLTAGSRKFTDKEISNIREKASHWGKHTADVSSTIDKTLYGEK
ncbi:MAG: hypothetical protein ACFFCQ_13865 [Promethearchaeota archaeon]